MYIAIGSLLLCMGMLELHAMDGDTQDTVVNATSARRRLFNSVDSSSDEYSFNDFFDLDEVSSEDEDVVVNEKILKKESKKLNTLIKQAGLNDLEYVIEILGMSGDKYYVLDKPGYSDIGEMIAQKLSISNKLFSTFKPTIYNQANHLALTTSMFSHGNGQVGAVTQYYAHDNENLDNGRTEQLHISGMEEGSPNDALIDINFSFNSFDESNLSTTDESTTTTITGSSSFDEKQEKRKKFKKLRRRISLSENIGKGLRV